MDPDIISRFGKRWVVAPGYDWLFDSDGLEGLLNGESGKTLRVSRKRRVVRGGLVAGGRSISLVIKIYKPPRFPLSLFRSRGIREYRALREAGRRGIETVRAIAVGEMRKWGALEENYLVTEELPACTPLSEVPLQSIGLRARRRIVRSVAGALREFHDSGVLHRDLHSGNILVSEVRRDPDGGPAVFIIDLQGAGFRSSLNIGKRIKNLVQLDSYYGIVSSRTDRFFFLKSYAGGLDCDIKKLAAAVEEGAVRARWCLWRKRRRRYLRDGKYARPLSCGGYSGLIFPSRDTESMRRLLSNPAAAYGKGRVIKSSRTNRVASLLMDGGEHIVIKWHRPPTLAKRAGTFMKASRGMKAWLGSRGLAERMIRGPVAVAFLDGRRLGFVTESFFMADFLDRATVLPHYVRDRRPSMSTSRRRVFCREMGKFLASLHRCGVYHADLKGSNIMVEDCPGGGFVFFLIDPEAVKFVMRVSPELAARNLARLDRYMHSRVSASDRLATLTSYLAALGRMDLLGYFYKAIGKINA